MPQVQATARESAAPVAFDRPLRSARIDRARPERPPGLVLLQACRPAQWVKNALVVIAPAAAGVLGKAVVTSEVLATFVAFCLLSSATYLLNDVRDREQDRRHPRKRNRPVASGALSPVRALRAALVLGSLGLMISVLVRPAVALVALCYLGLTTSYSLWWRQVVVIDLFAVAGCFLLRAIAGGVAVDVRLSRSFLIVTSACALLLVAGKRYAEMRDARARAATRATLARYSAGFLRAVIAAAALLACIAYARWAFTRPEEGPWLELSMVPFAIWLGRYCMMLAAGAGQAPERLILRDRALLGLAGFWAALFFGGVYAWP